MRANYINRRNDWLDRQAQERARARQYAKSGHAHQRADDEQARTRLAIDAGLSKSQRRHVPITLAPVAFLTRGDAE